MFKKGDKIVRTIGEHGIAITGGIYTVRSYEGIDLRLEEGEPSFSYIIENFSLVKPLSFVNGDIVSVRNDENFFWELRMFHSCENNIILCYSFKHGEFDIWNYIK